MKTAKPVLLFSMSSQQPVKNHKTSKITRARWRISVCVAPEDFSFRVTENSLPFLSDVVCMRIVSCNINESYCFGSDD